MIQRYPNLQTPSGQLYFIITLICSWKAGYEGRRYIVCIKDRLQFHLQLSFWSVSTTWNCHFDMSPTPQTCQKVLLIYLNTFRGVQRAAGVDLELIKAPAPVVLSAMLPIWRCWSLNYISSLLPRILNLTQIMFNISKVFSLHAVNGWSRARI